MSLTTNIIEAFAKHWPWIHRNQCQYFQGFAQAHLVGQNSAIHRLYSLGLSQPVQTIEQMIINNLSHFVFDLCIERMHLVFDLWRTNSIVSIVSVQKYVLAIEHPFHSVYLIGSQQSVQITIILYVVVFEVAYFVILTPCDPFLVQQVK